MAPPSDVLGALRAASRRGRQVLASTYVAVDLPALLTPGLDDLAGLERLTGADTVGRVLDVRPDTRTWLDDGTLDARSLLALRELQVDQVVVPEKRLVAIDRKLTLAQPFTLKASDGRPVTAVDGRHRPRCALPERAGDQVLAAQHLLADLAQLWLDIPQEERAVIAGRRGTWRPTRAFLEALLDGLADNPMLRGVTIDTVFRSIDPATTVSGRPLVGELRPASRRLARSPSAQIRSVEPAFGAALDARRRPTPLASLERRLLVAVSSDLSRNETVAYLSALDRAIGDALGQVQLPRIRSFTLTAREGEIPITVLNRSDRPMNVQLRLASDRLELTGDDTLTLELPPRARPYGSPSAHARRASSPSGCNSCPPTASSSWRRRVPGAFIGAVWCRRGAHRGCGCLPCAVVGAAHGAWPASPPVGSCVTSVGARSPGLRRAAGAMAASTVLSRGRASPGSRRSRGGSATASSPTRTTWRTSRRTSCTSRARRRAVGDAVPIFVERLSTRDDNEAWRSVSAVVTVAAGAIALAALFWLLAPTIIRLYTIGRHGPEVELQIEAGTRLLRYFAPQIAVYGLTRCSTAVLHALGRSVGAALTPVLNNVVVTGAIALAAATADSPSRSFVASHRGLRILGVGTTAGVVAQARLLPSRAPPRRNARRGTRGHEAARRIVRLSSWTVGYVMLNQVALWVVLRLANGGYPR